MSAFNIEELENCCKNPTIKKTFKGLYQSLGLITAIASSPDQIKPQEWISLLIIDEDARFSLPDNEYAKQYSSLLIGWWSRCMAIFDHCGTLQLPPKLGLTASGKPNKALVDFSSGYLRGYDWLSTTWDAMLPEDNQEAIRSISVLNAILARFVNAKVALAAQPELFAQLPDVAGCFTSLPKLLSAVGMLGKDLSASGEAEIKKSVRVPYRNAELSIGRNDLCPCGSGKKFKKCCLH